MNLPGTRLPWDPQYLIESLSDSTIYNAYYTVSQSGVRYPSKMVLFFGVVPPPTIRCGWDTVDLVDTLTLEKTVVFVLWL